MLEEKEKLNFSDVETYIQSGNIIFQTDKKLSFNEIETSIEKAIADHFGFEVPVIVRNQNEIKQIIAANPFLKNNKTEQIYLTFLKEIPSTDKLKKIKQFDFYPEQFKITGKNIFILSPGKYSETKLSNQFFESKLKVTATTRNWNTILKLSEIINW